MFVWLHAVRSFVRLNSGISTLLGFQGYFGHGPASIFGFPFIFFVYFREEGLFGLLSSFLQDWFYFGYLYGAVLHLVFLTWCSFEAMALGLVAGEARDE